MSHWGTRAVIMAVNAIGSMHAVKKVWNYFAKQKLSDRSASPLINLPKEIITVIIDFLRLPDMARLAQACKFMNQMVNSHKPYALLRDLTHGLFQMLDPADNLVNAPSLHAGPKFANVIIDQKEIRYVFFDGKEFSINQNGLCCLWNNEFSRTVPLKKLNARVNLDLGSGGEAVGILGSRHQFIMLLEDQLENSHECSIWDFENLQPLNWLIVLGKICSKCLIEDKFLLICCVDGSIGIWNILTGVKLGQYKFKDAANAIHYEDGKLFIWSRSNSLPDCLGQKV